MNRLYEKEVLPRLEGLSAHMKVGSIGKFSDGMKEYELPFVIADSLNPRAKQIFLSAGIHGDEVAGVYSLLDFLEHDAHNYRRHYSFVALPCLNPSGFEMDERHNHSGRNINRDFLYRSKTDEARLVKRFLKRLGRRFEFCLNAHEDPTDRSCDGFGLEDVPTEFYLYLVSPRKGLGHSIMRRIERKGYPICGREIIYGQPARKGIVWWAGTSDPEYMEADTLENHFLNYTSNSIAPETPTCWPLEDRIEAHKMTIISSIDYLRNANKEL